MAGTYDIITVGGGLGGAALARAMAVRGARVLVLEREKQFKDRVRGEFMAPWGVAEAQELGIDQLLRGSCAQDLPYVQMQIGSVPAERRDLRTTTPQGVAVLSVYHPAMQEVLLQAAADAGAEVRRGVIARDIKREGVPTVLVEQDGQLKRSSPTGSRSRWARLTGAEVGWLCCPTRSRAITHHRSAAGEPAYSPSGHILLHL